jgi:nucleoid DNA-binding protein
VGERVEGTGERLRIRKQLKIASKKVIKFRVGERLKEATLKSLKLL